MAVLTPENMTEAQIRHTSLSVEDAVELVKHCRGRWFGGFWLTRNGRATAVGYCGHYNIRGKGQCDCELGAIRWSTGCGEDRLVISIIDWDRVSLRAARAALTLAAVDFKYRASEIEVEIDGWLRDRRYESYGAFSAYWRAKIREETVLRRAAREEALDRAKCMEALRAAA